MPGPRRNAQPITNLARKRNAALVSSAAGILNSAGTRMGVDTFATKLILSDADVSDNWGTKKT